MAERSKTAARKASYLSARESRRISRENGESPGNLKSGNNRRKVPESTYTSVMRDSGNVVEV
jgi:peptide/nickel transport system ATP-binding protein